MGGRSRGGKGADAGDVGMVGHWGSAFGAEAAVFVPEGDLLGLACRGEQVVVHLEEKRAEVDSDERRGVGPRRNVEREELESVGMDGERFCVVGEEGGDIVDGGESGGGL